MKKSGATKISVILILLVFAVVGYYAYLSNKTRVRNTDVDMTLIQSVLSRNLKSDYPSTPKELMKYYHQIMECFYDGQCTDDEIEELGLKARELYDNDLLLNNPEQDYIQNLKSDIAEFRNKNRRITNYVEPKAANVESLPIDGISYARLTCSYTMVEGGMSQIIREVYLLKRESGTNRWKIYGWESESEFMAAQAAAEAGLTSNQNQETGNVEIPTVEIPKVQINIPNVGQ